MCLSAHNRHRGYSFTARPCYSAVGAHPTRIAAILEQRATKYLQIFISDFSINFLQKYNDIHIHRGKFATYIMFTQL